MDFCADTIDSSGCCSTDSEAMNKPFFTKVLKALAKKVSFSVKSPSLENGTEGELLE